MLIHHPGLRVNAEQPAETLPIWEEQGWKAGPHPDTDPNYADQFEPYAQFVPPVLPDPNAAPGPETFNPADHTVAEVVAYLDDANDVERAQVLEAESAGKARRGVLAWTAPALVAVVDGSIDADPGDETTTNSTEE